MELQKIVPSLCGKSMFCWMIGMLLLACGHPSKFRSSFVPIGMQSFSQNADHAGLYMGMILHKERRNAGKPSLDLLI